MLSPLLAAMLGATASIQYTLPPTQPRRSSSPRKCDAACARRYRIPAASQDYVSPKGRAMADDGTKCNVVGAKLCTSDGHQLWRASY